MQTVTTIGFDIAKGQAGFLEGACEGYIIGAVDSTIRMYCIPKGESGVQNGQAIDIVKLYLRNHPEKRHLLGSDLVAIAMKDKFPCN
jgi:hypothetical protein